MKQYDYEKLLKDFNKMTNGKVREEFAEIHNQRKFVERQQEIGKITENEYFYFIEPLDMAYQFLSGYLALQDLKSNGYQLTRNYKLVKRKTS